MVIYRIRFTREETVKFLSHLDILRVFERAVKRADLSIAFSQGYNPRPRMVFGLPLSVGVTSESEYVDMEFEGEPDEKEVNDKLNHQLLPGLRVLDIVNVDSAIIMKLITNASYNIGLTASVNFCDFEGFFRHMMDQEVIFAEKKTKKGMKEVNIRPLIEELTVSDTGEYFMINTIVKAGSQDNLRPDLLVEAASKFLNKDLDILYIHRTGLYIKKGFEYISPMSI